MTRLRFLGTKGEIEEYTETHRYHSSLLITSGAFRLLIDYGMLHRYTLEELAPDAILITHAHPDHYVWLNEDVKTAIPVYLTAETLSYGKFAPGNPVVVKPGSTFQAGSFSCLAYRVAHSIRCPAVGYKLKAPDGITLVYNPDLVDIVDKDSVLQGVDYYIGDGSAIKVNLVRRRDDVLFGHTRMTTQINWCKRYGIANIIFTHLGKETLAHEETFRQEHPEATLAYDGMEMELGAVATS